MTARRIVGLFFGVGAFIESLLHPREVVTDKDRAVLWSSRIYIGADYEILTLDNGDLPKEKGLK